jgi:hypothetical protein
VIQPARHTNDDRTDATNENAGRTIQLQSDYGDGVSIKIKDTDVDAPRSKDRDVDGLGTKDRDVDGISNADSAVRTGITPRLRIKNSNHAWFRRIFHKEAERGVACECFIQS